MTNRINPFTQSNYDLGIADTVGVDKAYVDTAFRESYNRISTPCIYCGNPAMFKIIPKYEKFNTAEIQDKGFICEHCTKQNYLSNEDYGIRPIK